MGSIVYYLYSLYSCYRFFSQKEEVNVDFSPPISILKPLWGLEYNLEENLTSFIIQNYPQYQIIFCVRDKHDPVILLVEKLINRYADRDLKLIVNDRIIGYNYKVSNLANGLKYCDYNLILIADSDIEVKEDYLKKIVQPLQQEKVGVVTCLYQSLSHNFTGIIESLGVACNFIPNVLTARQLEGVKFAFGSTILIRKKILEKIGSFERIANSLADDFLLGNLPTKLGYETVLSNYIVKHQITEEIFNHYLKRQIRWFRCIRVQRFKGYLGMIFTYGTINSIIFCLFNHLSFFSLIVLIITLSLKLLLNYKLSFKYLNNDTIIQYLGLIFVVDLIRFYIWSIALFGNKIKWGNNHFILKSNGELSIDS
ncbi:ceramide glucosyltransferase [Geminocystis sp. NIES-3709]|nr:ceramide glucosyltransferase [Geminocystis sp. NIES-3709]